MIYLTVVLVRLFFQVVILFCKVSVLSCKMVVMLFLALMGAINGYNRRRATRKAYERRRALQAEAYRRGVSTDSLSARWHPPTPISRRGPIDCTPAWQVSAPRDDPNWMPCERG